MNPSTVERMRNQSVSGKKVRLSKREFYRREKRVNYARNMALFAKAAEETGRDMNKFANLERRKQHKVRYDTWRRQEMPTGEDVRLENLHYANFLGDKYGDNGAKYNTNYPVNVRFCDSMVEIEEESYSGLDSLAKKARLLEEESYSGLYSRHYEMERRNGYGDDDSVSDLSLGSNYSSDEESVDLQPEFSQNIQPRVVGFTSVNSGDPMWYAGDFKELISSFGPSQKAYEMDWSELPVAEDEYERNEEEVSFDEMVAYMKTQIQKAEVMMMISGKRKAEGFEENSLKRARCDDETNNV
jgi:hypothetical protein